MFQFYNLFVKLLKNKIFNYCQLCEVNGYPNVYKWISDDDKLMYALHIKDGMLSDENIIQENCYITFTECI